MKKEKAFKGKRVLVRLLNSSDIKKAELFQDYINELAVDNTAFISKKDKVTLRQEKEWIRKRLSEMKKGLAVVLVASDKGRIIGTARIKLGASLQLHIGRLGISIIKDYRGIGLGKYLMKEILKLARTDLKPRPRMIVLSVFSVNKAAISLYKKTGFRQVGKIPGQYKFESKFLDELVMIRYL